MVFRVYLVYLSYSSSCPTQQLSIRLAPTSPLSSSLSLFLALFFPLSLSPSLIDNTRECALCSVVIAHHYKPLQSQAQGTHSLSHSLSHPFTVTLTLTRTFFFVEYCTKKEQQQQYLHKQIAPTSQRVLRRSFFSSSTSSSCKLVSFGL